MERNIQLSPNDFFGPKAIPAGAEHPPSPPATAIVPSDSRASAGGVSTSPFLFYEGKVQVVVQDETIWASQKGMAEIFDVTVQNISQHLQKIFATNELSENGVIKKFLITASDGKDYETAYYNLDAIISIGYRVNSYQATQFRRWATTVLKSYLIKGFALDDERLKQGKQVFGKDYFEELLERIREIRASERRFYQKITDLFAQCSIDYDKNSPICQQFYAQVQNKLHYATSGHTAAELLRRADASKPYMGLRSWKNQSAGGKITKLDVTTGKNYLDEEELDSLKRLVAMYLDFAENLARRRIPMKMMDWATKLDDFLRFNSYEVLNGFGTVTSVEAQRQAVSEFEKFRIIQDREYKSDFDQVVDAVTARKKLPALTE